MIIPVRCFTCGKVLADKWRAYQRKCQEYENGGENPGDSPGDSPDESTTPTPNKTKTKAKAQAHGKNFEPTYRGTLLDELGITKICCRRHMLGHVDCIDWI